MLGPFTWSAPRIRFPCDAPIIAGLGVGRLKDTLNVGILPGVALRIVPKMLFALALASSVARAGMGHYLTTPEAQQLNARAKIALSLVMVETKPPPAALWETVGRFSSVSLPASSTHPALVRRGPAQERAVGPPERCTPRQGDRLCASHTLRRGGFLGMMKRHEGMLPIVS